MSNSWTSRRLGEILSLEYGRALPVENRSGRGFPVIGSSGCTGEHHRSLIDGPSIIVGRKGTVGKVTWSDGPSWPIDTTFWVRPKVELDLRWLYWALSRANLERLEASTGIPGLSRTDAYRVILKVPSLGEQRRIAEILDIFDERLAVTKKIVDKLRSIKLGMRNDIFQNLTAEECAIGELGQVVTGSTPPSDEAIWGDVLPFVTPAEMGDWEFVDSSPRALSSQGQGLVRKIPRGSLLAVCIGFSYGKLGVAGVDLCTNQQINSLIPRDGIYGRYLYLALGQHIERLKGLSGLQVTPIVNKRLFSSILLPVPDTLEQQRIVDRLSAVQARIDSELGEVSKLESLKHALAEDLLTGRVRVPEAEAVVESL